MTKIIGISGRKQAGKNTVANIINGEVLLQKGMIQDFYIDNDGQLVIKTLDYNNNIGYGILDVTRKDNTFIHYAEQELWPYIKIYHFADPLKEMAINLFNIDSSLVYGNNDDKNTKTNLEWKNMPSSGKKGGNPTVREFLEYFGTKIVRKIYHNAWSEYTIKKILKEQSGISIIPDVRFPNEVEAIRDCGGIIIRLTRNIHNSDFEAESALDKENFDWSNFDHIICNENLSVQELCSEINKLKYLWGSI